MARPVSHDVIINIGFSLFRSLLLFLSLAYAARILSIELLGIFLLSRRVAVMVANALQIGVSQTLIRYIPLNHKNEIYQANLFYYSGAILVFISVLTLLLSIIFPEQILSFIYSGAVQNSSVIPWFILLVIATIFHYFLYTALLGSRRTVAANFFELMSAAGTVLIILLFFGPFSTIYDLLKPLSLMSATLSLGGVFYCMIVWPRIETVKQEDFASTLKTIGIYGIPRGVASFLDISVLVVLPWVIGAYPKDVSYLILSFTVLRILQVAIGPITQILSIAIAKQIGQGNKEGLAKSSRVIITSSLFLCVFILSVFWPWGLQFTHLWLGNHELSQGVWQYLSIISIAILPFTIFYTLRNLIDVVWVTPKNLWTLICVSLIQLCGSWILFGQGLALSSWVPYIFLLSATIMGVLSLFWLREYIPHLSYMKPWTLIAGGSGLLLINYICSNLSKNIGMPLAFILSLVIVVISMVILRKAPIGRDLLKQI